MDKLFGLKVEKGRLCSCVHVATGNDDNYRQNSSLSHSFMIVMPYNYGIHNICLWRFSVIQAMVVLKLKAQLCLIHNVVSKVLLPDDLLCCCKQRARICFFVELFLQLFETEKSNKHNDFMLVGMRLSRPPLSHFTQPSLFVYKTLQHCD